MVCLLFRLCASVSLSTAWQDEGRSETEGTGGVNGAGDVILLQLCQAVVNSVLY